MFETLASGRLLVILFNTAVVVDTSALAFGQRNRDFLDDNNGRRSCSRNDVTRSASDGSTPNAVYGKFSNLDIEKYRIC